jgi:hypothetical protein
VKRREDWFEGQLDLDPEPLAAANHAEAHPPAKLPDCFVAESRHRFLPSCELLLS